MTLINDIIYVMLLESSIYDSRDICNKPKTLGFEETFKLSLKSCIITNIELCVTYYLASKYIKTMS